MKHIKSIVDRIQLALRKGLSPYYSPAQIVDEIHAESMNLWKKYVDEFERTQRISVYMHPFAFEEPIAITGFIGHTAHVDAYITAISFRGKRVQLIPIGHWNQRINDSIRVPTDDYPVCMQSGTKFTVYPGTVTSLHIHRLRKPTKPVYAYIVSGDDYVYDDATSIDFEWPEILHDEIINRVLNNMGISQREGALTNYSNIEQQKEGV